MASRTQFLGDSPVPVAGFRASKGVVVTEWTVRRWARYGHERLYAESIEGTQLGYFDVRTGRYQSQDSGDLPLLENVIRGHLAAEAAVQQSPRPSYDLSGNLPGAAARERALAERGAQGRFGHGFARLLGAKTDEPAWRVGAEGEEAVAKQLTRLGPRWRMLHAVVVGQHLASQPTRLTACEVATLHEAARWSTTWRRR